MQRQPATTQRSPWRKVDAPSGFIQILDIEVQCFERNVHDGQLRALLGDEPSGLHLSVSHAFPTPRRDGTTGRYPTWDELADARYTLLPDDIDVVMFLPPPDEYVAVHPTTFHLHEYPPHQESTDPPVQFLGFTATELRKISRSDIIPESPVTQQPLTVQDMALGVSIILDEIGQEWAERRGQLGVSTDG